MAIYHIASHGYRSEPTEQDRAEHIAVFSAACKAAPFIEEFFVGRYAGNPADGYHDTACVKFKDLDAYRMHMEAPHGPDEATFLRENVARVTAFDVLTGDEPPETAAKILELYKMRWERFPEVAEVLRNDVDTRFPFL